MLALVELLGSSIDGGGIFCTPFRDTAPSILIRNSECSQQVSLCYVAIGILQSLDCSSIPDDRHYADPDYAVEERWQISQGIINRIRKRDATFQLQNIHASYLLLLPLHHIKNGGSFDTDVRAPQELLNRLNGLAGLTAHFLRLSPTVHGEEH